LELSCRECARLTYLSSRKHDPRVDHCRRDFRGFVESRSHLTSLRSHLVTNRICLEAQRRGFRTGAI
jgi:hypothetical protein